MLEDLNVKQKAILRVISRWNYNLSPATAWNIAAEIEGSISNVFLHLRFLYERGFLNKKGGSYFFTTPKLKQEFLDEAGD